MTHIARELLRGVISGLAGTAAMTAVQKLDQKLSGRDSSKAPAKVVEKALHVEPDSEKTEMMLANTVHWIYGSSWGAARPLIASIAPGPITATLAHFIAVWGAGMAVLGTFGLAPPPTQWEKKTVVKDALYHLTYASAAGLTYELLSRRGR